MNINECEKKKLITNIQNLNYCIFRGFPKNKTLSCSRTTIDHQELPSGGYISEKLKNILCLAAQIHAE